MRSPMWNALSSPLDTRLPSLTDKLDRVTVYDCSMVGVVFIRYSNNCTIAVKHHKNAAFIPIEHYTTALERVREWLEVPSHRRSFLRTFMLIIVMSRCL